MATAPVITEVTDPLASWDELEPLYRALHQHHEPLRNFTLPDGWPEAQRAMLTSEAETVLLVARTDDGVVAVLDGLIRVHPITGTRSGCINSAYVDPQWRRRGLTARMTERFQRWAVEHGATELSLGLDAANEVGIEAWRSLGFEAVSYRMARDLP
jgi:ribosomal protein S18 acetylase RimI-like enzyme